MSPLHLLRSSSERHAAGFTLVELLVAISITATVLASIYGIFGVISETKTRLEASSEAFHRARVIFDRLGREIRGAVPVGGVDGGGTFRGGRDERLRFLLELTTTAITGQQQGATGIALVRYRLAPDLDDSEARQFVLQRSEQSVLQTIPVAAGPGAVRLAPGVEDWQLRFCRGNVWYDDWDAATRGLPDLVEVSLDLVDSTGRNHRFTSAFELSGIAWRQ